MTREEIEKAIKNGESVWVKGIEHKLDKYYFVAEYNNEPTLYLMTCGYEEDDWNNYPVETITNIYKTKAEAKHYLHHANITRTETLPFLTWEEFKKEGYFKFYTPKNQLITVVITNSFTEDDIITIYNEHKEEFLANYILTEENFYKAYDECVRRFRGAE